MVLELVGDSRNKKYMNTNNKPLWWIVGIIVVLGIVALVVMLGKTAAPAPTADTTTAPATTGSSGKTAGQPSPTSALPATSMSMKQLIASGKTQKCSFSDTSAGSNTQGVLYMSGGKIRGDVTVTGGQTISGVHMIVMGQDTYIWMDGMTMGFKSTLAASNQPTSKPSTTGINADKMINYECTSWAADTSKFVLPTTVTFK